MYIKNVYSEEVKHEWKTWRCAVSIHHFPIHICIKNESKGHTKDELKYFAKSVEGPLTLRACKTPPPRVF